MKPSFCFTIYFVFYPWLFYILYVKSVTTKDKLQNKHKKIKSTVYERKSIPNTVFFSLYFHLLMYHYTSFVDLSVYNLSKLMHRTCLHIKTESSLEHLGTVLLATVTLINGNSVSTESTFALTRSPELARCCVYICRLLESSTRQSADWCPETLYTQQCR